MIKNLTEEQKHILLEEGTEPPGTSPLNYEKREGDYYCAGCGTKLFESNKKYESGSGWPSFFESLPNVLETKTENLIKKWAAKDPISQFEKYLISIKVINTLIFYILLFMQTKPITTINLTNAHAFAGVIVRASLPASLALIANH